MDVQKALTSLQEFIKLIVEAGVTTEYSSWAKANELTIAKLFCYKRKEGMPAIYELVRPFFHPSLPHPSLPLIGLNYTSAANANLFGDWISGWTDALRLCRGIVFDTNGNLIAFPFPKFFNFQEHEETKTTNLPDGPFVITSKYDGHLGIIFEYNGQLILTTRGSFTSPSAELGRQLLKQQYPQLPWQLVNYNPSLTLLVEIIAPETQVHLNYGNKRYFMLVGAFNRETLVELSYRQLQELGRTLHITVARRLMIGSIDKLLTMIADPRFTDREGYVVRYANGLRVKFKFRTYLQKMFMSAIAGKGHAALMQWWLNDELANKLALLPEEVVTKVNKMWSEITTVMAGPGELQAKWQRLYLFYNDNADTLLPTDHPNQIKKSTFQSICREFVRKYSQKK